MKTIERLDGKILFSKKEIASLCGCRTGKWGSLEHSGSSSLQSNNFFFCLKLTVTRWSDHMIVRGQEECACSLLASFSRCSGLLRDDRDQRCNKKEKKRGTTPTRDDSRPNLQNGSLPGDLRSFVTKIKTSVACQLPKFSIRARTSNTSYCICTLNKSERLRRSIYIHLICWLAGFTMYWP